MGQYKPEIFCQKVMLLLLPARCMSLVFIAQSITMPRPIKLTCPTAFHLTPRFQLLFTPWYDRFCEFLSPFLTPVSDSPPIPLFLQVLLLCWQLWCQEIFAFSDNLSFYAFVFLCFHVLLLLLFSILISRVLLLLSILISRVLSVISILSFQLTLQWFFNHPLSLLNVIEMSC